VSVKVSSWVWHGEETAGLAGNEMILLLALADVADDKGRCRYLADDDDLTYASLAVKARVSRSTLIRLLAKLREVGLVDQKPGVKGRPNEFRIVVPWASEFGINLEPEAGDEVSSDDEFGFKLDEPSSYRRNDVNTADLFDEFWSVYPRKAGKGAARKAFAAAAKSAGGAAVVAGARRFALDPNLPDKQFIPHPATWLSRGSWEDEPLPPRTTSPAAAAAAAPSTEDFGAEDAWMAFR